MADSKRAAAKPRRKGARVERLTPLSLVLNAAAVFVAAPVLFVLSALIFEGSTFGGTERNQNLFLGAVTAVLGVFALLLGGLKVHEHVKARRRFRELLEGEKKSAVLQNLDELSTLARTLGPDYRRRLEGRLDELGIKR